MSQLIPQIASTTPCIKNAAAYTSTKDRAFVWGGTGTIDPGVGSGTGASQVVILDYETLSFWSMMMTH